MMRLVRLWVDFVSTLEAVDRVEVASDFAWVGVALFLIAAVFGKSFGLASLPKHDKTLLAMFMITMVFVALFVLNGHEIPVLIWGLLVSLVLDQLAFAWWKRTIRRSG